MAETAEQAKIRYASKDAEYARLASTGKWPMLACETCRYYACMGCGRNESGPCLLCRSCSDLMTQRTKCCKRDWHHVGDCCTHCGNDERSL
jgi:hypothetical protein